MTPGLCVNGYASLALFSNWGTPFYSQGEKIKCLKITRSYAGIKRGALKRKTENNKSRLGKYKKYTQIRACKQSEKRFIWNWRNLNFT